MNFTQHPYLSMQFVAWILPRKYGQKCVKKDRGGRERFPPPLLGGMGEKTDYFSFKYTAIAFDKLKHNLQLVLDFLEGLWDRESLRYP